MDIFLFPKEAQLSPSHLQNKYKRNEMLSFKHLLSLNSGAIYDFDKYKPL